MKLVLTSILAVLAGISLTVSCVTEYQPDPLSLPPSLVVEGQITDGSGPYIVRLTRTADYSYKAINLLETGAVVTIEDNAGNRETLLEQSGGFYVTRTNGIQGVVGRSYKLLIQTKDGLRYESEPERLTAAPPILNVYTEYRNEAVPGTATRRQGWDVYIDTKDPPEPGNYYRWEWTHYEYIDVCQKTLLASGNAYTGRSCCTPCWDITRCYNCISVNSDANINGQTISKQYILTAPYTSGSKYYVEIQQQAISKGAYAFWKSVRGLVNNTGGLFDPAPAAVQGNIRCVSDPKRLVYGYFGATGLSQKDVYVDRSNGQGAPDADLPVSVPVPSACVPCENSLYRTPIQPRGWVY